MFQLPRATSAERIASHVLKKDNMTSKPAVVVVMSLLKMLKEAVRQTANVEKKKLAFTDDDDDDGAAMRAFELKVVDKAFEIAKRDAAFCGRTDANKKCFETVVFLPEELATFDDVQRAFEVAGNRFFCFVSGD